MSTDLDTQSNSNENEGNNVSNNTGSFPSSSPEVYSSDRSSLQKQSPTRLAEDLGSGARQGAILYIQNRTTGRIAYRTSKFYLTQMAIGLRERSQILETFGTSNVSFFGQSTKVYNFAGAALDWKSQNTSTEYWQASSLLHLYDNHLRGTELVSKNHIAVIKILNHTIFGYPLSLNVTYDQGSDKFASFGLQWLVTKHLLGLPGLITESQLESNSAPINRSGLAAELQAQLDRIAEVVKACMTALQTGSDTLGWTKLADKNVEELRNIHSESSLIDQFSDLKDKLIEVRELGDGQVSPTISQMFGVNDEKIEAWFSEVDVSIEQLTNTSTVDVMTPLGTFRAKLEFIQNFSDTLLSLWNSIQG